MPVLRTVHWLQLAQLGATHSSHSDPGFRTVAQRWLRIASSRLVFLFQPLQWRYLKFKIMEPERYFHNWKTKFENYYKYILDFHVFFHPVVK